MLQRFVLETEEEESTDNVKESVEDEYSDEDKTDSCGARQTSAMCASSKKRVKYNTEDITNIALASLRHHIGLRETAETTTAGIDAWRINKFNTALLIDHNKVRKVQETLMRNSIQTNIKRMALVAFSLKGIVMKPRSF